MTAFVFHAGRTYPRCEGWARHTRVPLIGQALLGAARSLEYRRNPRTVDYMKQLARQAYPDIDPAQLVDVGDDRPVSLRGWDVIDEIVLLWPDGNGTGWSAIEREVFRRKRPTARVTVLNGRRRSFTLTHRAWRHAQWRRALEKTFVVEFGVLALFLVTSPLLALWDRLRGKKALMR